MSLIRSKPVAAEVQITPEQVTACTRSASPEGVSLDRGSRKAVPKGSVPEPASLILLFAGLAAIGVAALRRWT